jgi:YD repeat-containing protein
LRRTLGTILLGCPLFIVSLRCEAQNLVPNPSFEDYVTCPSEPGFNPNSKPLYWDRWDQSPEYFNSCAGTLGNLDTLLDVPRNGMTWQYAYDGEGYVGGATYTINDIRELIGAPLIQPLVIGQTYYASFYTNLALRGSYWQPRWASNKMGLLFTMDEHIWSMSGNLAPEFIPRDYAHVYCPDVVTDTAGWTLVSGSFVADSAYQYAVIGNFFSDALTDTVHMEQGPSGGAYYLYDNICVSPLPGQCPMVTSVEDVDEPVIQVFPNPVTSMLHVQFQGVFNLSVYDGAGRLMLAELGSGSRVVIVDMLAPGRYLLVVDLENGSRSRSSFVVMR